MLNLVTRVDTEVICCFWKETQELDDMLHCHEESTSCSTDPVTECPPTEALIDGLASGDDFLMHNTANVKKSNVHAFD